MALNHFSKEFADRAELLVSDWKAAGVSAVDAARNLEIACGKANEEFAVDGIPLIERIYDGRYDRTTSSFEPNPPAPAPPVAPTSDEAIEEMPGEA